MTKVATDTDNLNLTIDRAHLAAIGEIAQKMAIPGNPVPSHQTVIRVAIAEFIQRKQKELTT